MLCQCVLIALLIIILIIINLDIELMMRITTMILFGNNFRNVPVMLEHKTKTEVHDASAMSNPVSQSQSIARCQVLGGEIVMLLGHIDTAY